MSDSRKDMRTDDSKTSTKSITDSLRDLMMDNWHAGIYLMSNSELEEGKPEYILSRMLSTRSAISTDSSLAEMNKRAQDDAVLQTFASVGGGQTGTVYVLKGTSMNDFENHVLVSEAFRGVSIALRFDIHVPDLKMWVSPKSNNFWDYHSKLSSEDVSTPNFGLVSERIYPLPEPVRSALVDTFAPRVVQQHKTDFLRVAKNKDCLVRLYLGRRNNDVPPIAADKFHLRNFPLHVNEMERLKLDTSYYAKLMARALAIIHWRAGLDANDVEFVFGSSPIVSARPTAQDLIGLNKYSASKLFRHNFHHRTVSIWLLDFNMCQKFTKDASGLKKLVDGFFWNDPYYPRPGSTVAKDKELWAVFSQHYVEVSAEIVSHNMPTEFIKAIKVRAEKRSGNNMFA